MSIDDRQSGAENSRKKRRWIWPVLIISLGLNLLFVGLVAGRIWQHGYGGHGATHDRIITGAMEKLSANIPVEKRRRARELLQGHRAALQPFQGQLNDARNAVREAALAESFDEKNLADGLRRLREIRSGMHNSLHMTVMALMKDLTFEERQELVKYIRAGFRQRRGHWRHREDAAR